MIFLVNAENRQLFAADLVEMHRQRKRVFVDANGWNVPVVGDMEIDCYDSANTTYLIAKAEADGPVLASVRLLPTVTPHLMTDLFVAACNGAVPRGPTVWEASRFCAMPADSGRTRVELLWEIIGAVMEAALLFGIEQVTFVANAALLPLAVNCGWDAKVLGPTLPDGRDEITAVAVKITPEGLREVRSRYGIASPVTRFLTPTTRIAA
jgi:N-acyl-L-homoserine lactone synthetase